MSIGRTERIKWQSLPGTVVVRTDSDWAGCRVTRRGTSGLAVFLGEHLLFFASSFQKSVALSSGEAELGAQVAGVAEGSSLQKLCAEFGLHLSLHSLCDPSAARGIMNRSGTGRMKHLEVKHLWVQELVAKKLLTVQWVPRQENAADVLAHSTSRSEFTRLLRLLGVSFLDKPSIESLSEGVLECADALEALSSRPRWGVKQSRNPGRLCNESVCLCLS